jgi:hypothetical protein
MSLRPDKTWTIVISPSDTWANIFVLIFIYQ